MLVEHKDFLLSLDEIGKERIARGLFCYAEAAAGNSTAIGNPSTDLENRWIIKSILKWSGVDLPCQWKVAVGVAETAILGAATAVASPTGVGAVLGGIAVGSSYADTLHDAINCN